MKKILSCGLRLLLILVLLVVLLVVAFIGCTHIFSESYRTEDPSEYLQITGHITNEGMDVHSGLFVFPASIEGLEDVEYRYSCKYDGLFNDCMIYLKATYSDAEYAAEVERLSNITCSVSAFGVNAENSILYSEDLFRYPAYIAIYDCDLSYEYALVDDATNTIVYIYLNLYEVDGFLPEEYFPLEYMDAEILGGSNWENHNIYYTAGDGMYIYYKD